MVHGLVWRTLCSVSATGAHVAQPFFMQFVIFGLEVFTGRHLLFQLVVYRTGGGWFELGICWKRTSMRRHVMVMHGHVWRTLCSVYATAQPFEEDKNVAISVGIEFLIAMVRLLWEIKF